VRSRDPRQPLVGLTPRQVWLAAPDLELYMAIGRRPDLTYGPASGTCSASSSSTSSTVLTSDDRTNVRPPPSEGTTSTQSPSKEVPRTRKLRTQSSASSSPSRSYVLPFASVIVTFTVCAGYGPCVSTVHSEVGCVARGQTPRVCPVIRGQEVPRVPTRSSPHGPEGDATGGEPSWAGASFTITCRFVSEPAAGS
jgi:hypothetical protein